MAPGYLAGEQLEEGRAHLTRYTASNRWTNGDEEDDIEPLIGLDEDQPFEVHKKTTAYYVRSNTRLRMRRALTGTAVTLTLVCLLVVFFVALKRADNKPAVRRDCSLRSTKPTELGPPRAVVNSGTRFAKNMAKLKGYIRVYDPVYVDMYEGGYLSLDIKTMDYSPHFESFSLEDECSGVTLTVKRRRGDDKSVATLESLNWFFAVATRFDAPTKQSYIYCNINEPAFEHTFPAHDSHYSCLEPQRFQCQKFDHAGQRLHPVAELVIESLELELDGNELAMRRGHFSKPAYAKSCNE